MVILKLYVQRRLRGVGLGIYPRDGCEWSGKTYMHMLASRRVYLVDNRGYVDRRAV